MKGPPLARRGSAHHKVLVGCSVRTDCREPHPFRQGGYSSGMSHSGRSLICPAELWCGDSARISCGRHICSAKLLPEKKNPQIFEIKLKYFYVKCFVDFFRVDSPDGVYVSSQ